MSLDFVQSLTEQLNKNFCPGSEPLFNEAKIKELLIQAADVLLVAASQGEQVKSQLTQKEIGYIVAALMFDQPGFNRGAVLHAPRRK